MHENKFPHYSRKTASFLMLLRINNADRHLYRFFEIEQKIHRLISCFPISITHLCFLSFLELTGGWIDMKKASLCATHAQALVASWLERERGLRSPKNKTNKIIESRRHPDLARSTLNSVIDEAGSWNPSLGAALRVLLLWWVGQLI